MTTNWIIEPRDTLLIRDGRPMTFGMPSMRSLDFPWPSTIAGMVRSRVGLDTTGTFVLSAEEAKRIEISGPWLVELAAGTIKERFVPAPRDVVAFERGEAIELHRLRPRARPADVMTDLDPRLELVGPAASRNEKPARGVAFWRWSRFQSWLESPGETMTTSSRELGMWPLEHERRIHVAIAPESLTAAEGQLFATDALRFSDGESFFGLEFRADDARLGPGLTILGGEGRMSFLRRTTAWQPPIPPNVNNGLAGRARVVLVTPALFATGAIPDAINGARVVAAVVPRAEIISGFDVSKGPDGRPRGPKPTRRAVAAGSVFWVDLAGLDVAAWLRRTWWSHISDDEQDRRDGFGLAVVGVE